MTQAPAPGTKPLRSTHDLGEIVGYSYRLYAANFLPLFALALLTVPLQLLSGVIQQSSDSEGVQTITGLLQLPGAFVSLVVAAALVHAIHRITGGERAAFNDGLDAAFDRLGALFSTTFLLIGLAFAAFFAGPFLAILWLFKKDATIDGRRNWWLAIVPFALLLYLAIRWAFNTQAVMISGKQNWAALDDSADAVRNSWWRVFAILIVVGLIALGPSMMAQLATFLPPLAAATIISAVSALVLPFAVIAQVLLYYDLKIRTTVVPVDPVLEPMEGVPE